MFKTRTSVVTDGLVRRSYFRLQARKPLGRILQEDLPGKNASSQGEVDPLERRAFQSKRFVTALTWALTLGLRLRGAFKTRDLAIKRVPARGAKEPQKGGDGGNGTGTAVITRPKTQTRRPSMYRVLLLNDDYTPMEFVVSVLKKYFNKGPEEATRIMLHVHQHGVGECGIFTYEVAETKVTQVMDYARKHQHPLQCIMEKK
jgi:ATP-dependent Clp protease adaptor protein ClpS